MHGPRRHRRSPWQPTGASSIAAALAPVITVDAHCDSPIASSIAALAPVITVGASL
jgi:hypothetical protein